MSVQNLREKFNQPSNGTPPPPGTSFGAPKLHSKQELSIPRTESANSAKTGSCSFISSNNGKLSTQLHTRLRNSKSPSPDRQNHGSKTYINGCTEPIKHQRKSPEQSQQDIILRKWNRTSISPDSNKTAEKPDTITTKAKNSVLRYINQVTLDEKKKNFDKQTDSSTLSEQTNEILKRAKPENSVNNVQLPDSDTCDNNSNSVNSRIHVKMNAGHKTHTQNNPHLISSGCKKSSVVERWKVAQEESEAKKFSPPKVLSSSSSSDNDTFERKYITLQKDYNQLKSEYKKKNEQLEQLRKLSEEMYKEYDQLRNQYKLETSTMEQAMTRATQWYRQNRELKRQSTALLQHVMTVNPECLPQMEDELDTSEHDNEIEALRNTIRDLTKDVSKLQAELNCIKLRESEAQEQIVILNRQLEAERWQKSNIEVIYKEHQYETSGTDDKLGTVEEKLRITETELQIAVQRATQAESESAALSNRVAELEDELKELKNKTISAPPAPPLPPPPPPPPPLPSSTQSSLYSTMTLKIKKSAAKAESSEGSAADQMADLLGIQNKTPSLKVPGGAIDEIINEIKGGRFTLKATEKQNVVKKEEQPPVVNEMMNVLGTLRRQGNRQKTE